MIGVALAATASAFATTQPRRALAAPPRRRAGARVFTATSPEPSPEPLDVRGGGGDVAAPARTIRGVPVSVLAVLAGAFLNLLGFTMAGPITPALAEHFQLPVGSKVGALTSAYPMGMLVGLLVWPQISDREGWRKKIIVGSLFGVGVGLFLQALALHLKAPYWVFLGLRVLSGLSAGASPVSKAYLADAATDEQLPRWLAWREASSTLAFIVGPLFGGLLFFSSSSLATVVGVTSAGSLLAAAITAAFVEEPKASLSPASPPPKLLDAGKMPTSCPLGRNLAAAVATICAMSALENAGSACWDAFGAVLAQQRFGLDARGVGLMLTSGACISFAVSTTCFDRVRSRVGLVNTAVIGLALIAAGLGTVGAATGSLPKFVAAAALYQLGKPLYAPTVPTLLLQCVPPSKRGLAMGVDSIVNTVARAAAPLLLGGLLKSRGAAAAFAVASTLVASAAGLALLRADRSAKRA